MKILPFSDLDPGYEPSSIELNTQEGVLDITNEGRCTLIEESKISLETLILRCTLSPFSRENKAIRVRKIVEGQSLKDVPLYDPQAVTYDYEEEPETFQWQGVALKYTGQGRGIFQGKEYIFQGITCSLGHLDLQTPLYIKPFKVERENYEERVTTFRDGSFLVSPPGLIDGKILRGYGGSYKVGQRLEDIQQIYYTLTSTHDRTRVQLFTSIQLLDNLTPPPEGGKTHDHQIVFYPPPEREEYLSLSGTLAEGYAHVTFIMNEVEISFSSFHSEKIPGHPHLLNVHFQP